MKDDKSKDDQYQYPHEEYSSEPSENGPHTFEQTPGEHPEEASTQKKNVLTPVLHVLKSLYQKNPKIFFILIAVVALSIFFKLVHQSTQTPTLDNTATQNLNTPAPTPAPTVTAAAPAPVASFGLDHFSSSANDHEIATLKKELAENQNTIADLQMKVHSLEEAMSTMAQAQENVNQELLNLTNKIAQYKDTAAKKSTKTRVIPSAPLVYTVRAVVPGRAWLQGSDGSTPSVAVGDTLPQYGKITQILPDRSMVLTSSGKTIQLGNSNE